MQKKIAIIGNSITAGNPGVSFTKFIEFGQIDNYGLGGETIIGLRARICKIKPHDYLIIEIGINDILLPFLKTYSSSWEQMVNRIIRRGSIPTHDKLEFTVEYEKLLFSLHRSNTILLTIPCCGEILDSSLNKKISEYNSVIKLLCAKYRMNCIDIHSIQRDVILSKGKSSGYFITKSVKNTVMDSIFSKIGLSDNISLRRGLVTTIDGVHFNSAFAKKAGKFIESKIRICQ